MTRFDKRRRDAVRQQYLARLGMFTVDALCLGLIVWACWWVYHL